MAGGGVMLRDHMPAVPGGDPIDQAGYEVLASVVRTLDRVTTEVVAEGRITEAAGDLNALSALAATYQQLGGLIGRARGPVAMAALGDALRGAGR